MTSKTNLGVGDVVRVSFTTTITGVGTWDHRGDAVMYKVEGASPDSMAWTPKGAELTRLSGPPEPKWVLGDLVVANGVLLLRGLEDNPRDIPAWHNQYGILIGDGVVTAAWEGRRMDIIRKADAS